MSKSIAYCSLIAFSAAVIVLSAAAPWILGDANSFLNNFVNHEFLNVLGVILAITLASAAQLHLTFNSIEEKCRRRGMNKSRAGVKSAAYWLISLFLIGVAIVVIKPLGGDTGIWTSLMNGAALFVLFWNVLILLTLTQTVFSIRPDIGDG